MKKFEREERYIVLKMEHLNHKQIEMIKILYGHAMRKSVVVESTWAEYEPVWNMIEQRFLNEAGEENDRQN